MPPRRRKPAPPPKFLDHSVRGRFVVGLALALLGGVGAWAKGITDTIGECARANAVLQGELRHLERTDEELKTAVADLRRRMEGK